MASRVLSADSALFDESLESSFSDSEVGFLFSTFWKIKSSRIQKWWESTRVVLTGGSRPELHLVRCVSADISCRVSITMIL